MACDPHHGQARGRNFDNKRSRGAVTEDSTVTHNYGGVQAGKRNGHQAASRTLSPHGLKRRPVEDHELDYHRATKQLRRLGFNELPSAMGGSRQFGCEAEGTVLRDLDYSIQNQELKQMHLQYLRERSNRGLAPMEPQDISSDEEDMC